MTDRRVFSEVANVTGGHCERGGRDDVAIDVMTIVRSVLWRGVAFT